MSGRKEVLTMISLRKAHHPRRNSMADLIEPGVKVRYQEPSAQRETERGLCYDAFEKRAKDNKSFPLYGWAGRKITD